jgi:hypothetical protein
MDESQALYAVGCARCHSTMVAECAMHGGGPRNQESC